MKIKDLGFNEQILTAQSSLLGETAKDENSFTKALLRLFKKSLYDNVM